MVIYGKLSKVLNPPQSPFEKGEANNLPFKKGKTHPYPL
jgi:hypothetical protein